MDQYTTAVFTWMPKTFMWVDDDFYLTLNLTLTQTQISIRWNPNGAGLLDFAWITGTYSDRTLNVQDKQE